MKAIISILSVILFSCVSCAQWDSCPFGEVNDTYPGDCPRYIDTDGDGICDLSQPAPQDRGLSTTTTLDLSELISGSELKAKTVSEAAELYGIDSGVYARALGESVGVPVKESDNFQLLHDNYGLQPSVAKDIAASLLESGSTDVAAGSIQKPRYNLIPLSIAVVALYVLSYLLYAKGRITLASHRKLWNVLLLLTFLVSGVLGVLLVIRINWNIPMPFPFNILYMHVEAGIAMAVISVFHILWHWKYYKSIIRR